MIEYSRRSICIGCRFPISLLSLYYLNNSSSFFYFFYVNVDRLIYTGGKPQSILYGLKFAWRRFVTLEFIPTPGKLFLLFTWVLPKSSLKQFNHRQIAYTHILKKPNEVDDILAKQGLSSRCQSRLFYFRPYFISNATLMIASKSFKRNDVSILEKDPNS